MRGFLLMLGLPDMGLSQLFVIVALVAAGAFFLAWIADAILGDGAFGVLLNTLLLLVGVVLGTLLWRRLGFTGGTNPVAISAAVAAGSGIGLLLICGVLRRWI